MARNAVKPPDLSEIRGGVRDMGTLRYMLSVNLSHHVMDLVGKHMISVNLPRHVMIT